MGEDRMPLPHSLTLKDRKQLTMSGVSEVLSFDDSAVVLRTQLGILQIQGRELQLKNLSLEGGQVSVDGCISALVYEEPRQTGWLQRLLG